MQKAIIRNLVLCTCLFVMISCLSGCIHKPKRDVYEIETDLGDRLSIEVYLSGNLHGMYLKYEISSKDYSGLAFFTLRNERRTEIPENSIDTFATVGSWGKTRFYTLQNTLIYVYNNERIDQLYFDYKLDKYKLDARCFGDDYMEMCRSAISDIIKSNLFIYIYQYGEILAYEENEEMKNRLQRYAEGDFTEEELSVNENSEKTPEEMMLWAKDMLSKYFLS